MKRKTAGVILFTCFVAIIAGSCSKSSASGAPVPVPPVVPPVVPATNDVDYWLTKTDASVLLAKQATVLSFGTTANNNPFIDVDSSQSYQEVDGFGFTLTGGSAAVIDQLDAAGKASLLSELFGSGPTGIAISYLRLSVGASDLDANVFSYDDMPAGQTDPSLSHFTIAPDKAHLLPLLKEILQVNPAIKIIAAPWSPPVWMKDNGSSIGGSLQPQYYGAYAQYLARYIREMKAEGVTIDAITPQNEPLNPKNNPSMLMLADQQRDFIKNNLGPEFKRQGITTKIVLYDHNCDHPEYPRSILDDPAARAFIDGSAFHLYNGDISVLSQLHNAYPGKNLYFTEQYTPSTGAFAGDLQWHIKNVIIGSMRNWSRVALEWNLANDPSFGPHTPGGCTTCKGALTIGTDITRNVGYYIIAHASKFVPAGSVRIYSNITGSLQNVAFRTPSGKKVLIVENEATATQDFNIRYKSRWVSVSVPAGSVATFTW